jgi:hypothetical protein
MYKGFWSLQVFVDHRWDACTEVVILLAFETFLDSLSTNPFRTVKCIIEEVIDTPIQRHCSLPVPLRKRHYLVLAGRPSNSK